MTLKQKLSLLPIIFIAAAHGWFWQTKAEDDFLSENNKQLLEETFKNHLVVNKNSALFSLFNFLRQDLTYLKDTPEGQAYCKASNNIYIFHGPPGNGKSTTAETFAQVTNAEFKRVVSSSLVGSFQGEGPKKVIDIVEHEVDVAKKSDKKIVLFFDEIDAIASTRKNRDSRKDDENSIMNLWNLCDKYHQDPHVLFIFATNKFESLDAAFRSRVNSDAIEFKNPDTESREKIIRLCAFNTDINFSQDSIKYLVKNTDGYSIRFIERVVQRIKRLEMDNQVKFNDKQIQHLLQHAKLVAQIQEKDDKTWIEKYGTHVTIGLSATALTFQIIDVCNRLSTKTTTK